MSTWSMAPIATLPQLTLINWGVFEVPLPHETGLSTRHFVGVAHETGHGQVSSGIVTFDPISGSGVTQSGRIYQLVGRPGSDADAEYVWERWKEINSVSAARDVSEEIFSEIQRKASN